MYRNKLKTVQCLGNKLNLLGSGSNNSICMLQNTSARYLKFNITLKQESSQQSQYQYEQLFYPNFADGNILRQSSNTIKEQDQQQGRIRSDWTKQEIQEIYDMPLLDLIYKAAKVHRTFHDPSMVQRCTLLSIKTGGCPETCTYCAQSSSWSKTTGLKAEKLMNLDDVYEAALKAKESGTTRFCMGAAWRGPSQVGERQFQRVLDMVTKVRALGMEVCTTLGMLTKDQADKLNGAGLTCYNHNLDTSPEYYNKITSSRKYSDRLETLDYVRKAGIGVCSGGILGLGESDQDRVGLIHSLATLPEHPESVPINALVSIKGTPLQGRNPPTALEMARAIATARISMPESIVRLAAGRLTLNITDQALCFMAGANSIFDGEKLLTTPNNDQDVDTEMFNLLGLQSKPAFQQRSLSLKNKSA